MSLPAREYLQALLRDDLLEEMLRILLDPTVAVPAAERQDATLLSARLSDLARQQREGTIPPDQVTLERNRIRKGLTALVDELPTSLQLSPTLQKAEQRLRFRWALSMGIYLLLAAGLGFWLFQPKANLRVDGDLLVERLSFDQQDGTINFSDLDLDGLRLADFQRLSIEADSFSLDPELDDTWEPAVPVSGAPLSVEAIPGLSGQSVNLGEGVEMGELSFPHNSRVTIEQIEKEQPDARLVIERMGEMSGSLFYTRQLILQPELVIFQGLAEPIEWNDPVGLALIGPGDAQRRLTFTSSPDLLTLELLPASDSSSMGSTGLLVKNLDFLRKADIDGPQTATTVLGGRLSLEEVGQTPLKVVEVDENQRLTIAADSEIEIRQLRLSEEGIQIRFTAQMDRIELGEQYELQNPSRVEWYWHNKRWLLIFVWGAVLGAIFFLPGPVREKAMAFVRQVRGR